MENFQPAHRKVSEIARLVFKQAATFDHLEAEVAKLEEMIAELDGVSRGQTKLDDLSGLIRRLEEATEGSRELDGDIAEALGLPPLGAPRMRGIAAVFGRRWDQPEAAGKECRRI